MISLNNCSTDKNSNNCYEKWSTIKQIPGGGSSCSCSGSSCCGCSCSCSGTSCSGTSCSGTSCSGDSSGGSIILIQIE